MTSTWVRSIHSLPIPGITDKSVEWTIDSTVSLYLTYYEGMHKYKIVPSIYTPL